MRRCAALAGAIAWSLAGAASAGNDRPSLCATAASDRASPPYLAVFSAFPAELAPLVAAAEIDETVEIEGAAYHLGRLDGINVVLGLLGIGMVNARTVTERVLAHFEIAGIVVSGVAGSHHRIGDVVVATRWVADDRRRVFPVNRALLALARRAAAVLPAAAFQQCTPVPPTMPEAPLVCLLHQPAVVVEDRGVSGDDFNDQAFPCFPDGGEIFGCGLPGTAALAMTAPTSPDVVDMETAAVAAVAAEHHVPLLAMRAVSDGAGDPLGDRGFPLQFFDYYRLAAFNAARVTRALVAELGAFAHDPAGMRVCRALAHRRWHRASNLIRSAP
jgi:adenosylhomocysteine nucleosidase